MQHPRKGWTRYIVLTVVIFILAIFPTFYLLRNDAKTVAALSSAGTVAAAGFAAMAGIAAMRAANDSSITAQRAREALARAVRPALTPDVRFDGQAKRDENGCAPAMGRIMSASSNAVDVFVEWHYIDGTSASGRVPRLESWRPNLPDGSDISFSIDLGPMHEDEWWTQITMVRALYWDEQRLAQWESIWRTERLGEKGWLSPVSMRIAN